MEKRNLQKLLMMQLLLSLAGVNQSIVNLMLACKNGFISLGDIVTRILALTGPQSQSAGGGGSQKQFMRSILNQVTFSIISAVKGYALSVKNYDLATEMSYSASAVARIKSDLIAGRVQNWITLITPNLAGTASWGVDQAAITGLQTALTNYNTVLLLPAQKINKHKSNTKDINKLIKDGMEICYNTLDKTMGRYAEMGQTKWVQDYKIARKLKPVPILHTRLEATVVNEVGEGYFNVNVLVEPFSKNGKDYIGVSANTNIGGICTVSEFEPGNRYVTISGPGIQTQRFGPFKFESGKAFTQSFTCRPAFDNMPAPQAQKQKVSK